MEERSLKDVCDAVIARANEYRLQHPIKKKHTVCGIAVERFNIFLAASYGSWSLLFFRSLLISRILK
jgi:hypothetical protein